jgi:opacity protein-like surface antigen
MFASRFAPARHCSATGFFFLVAPLLALFLLPAPGHSQEVSYSVVPTFEEVRWNDAFGLEDSRLLGARVSLDFGPYFSLQPFYSWKDEVGIRDGLVPPAENATPDLFDVKAFGADMQVNLARGSLVPFLRGGGGVLRTDDVEAGRLDRILLRGGGGVRVGFGGSAGLELSAERWATRLGAPLIPDAVADEDFPDDGIVSSTVFGAGLRLPFGGATQAADGVGGILPGVFVEPYAARIDFADELRLERQYVAGARAGVDFNRNVGLRGYYWRGVDDDFSEWMRLDGYGIESQIALSSGAGLSPFLVAGLGRIDFKDDFSDLDGSSRTSKDHLTLGGGAAFALGDHTRVELGARNLLTTVGTDLEDVTSPDELVSNWQFSAGLSLTLGASGRRDEPRPVDRERERFEAELARLQEENRRLRRGEDPETVVARADTLAPRTMTIPVPEVGEVILRYGEAYAGAAATEAMVVAGDTAQARLQRELLEARLPEMIREIVREELDRVGVRPGEPAPAPRRRCPPPMSPSWRTLDSTPCCPSPGRSLPHPRRWFWASGATWVGSVVPSPCTSFLSFLSVSDRRAPSERGSWVSWDGTWGSGTTCGRMGWPDSVSARSG